MNELDLHVSPTLYARLRRAAKQAKISVSEFAQRELARVSTPRQRRARISAGVSK